MLAVSRDAFEGVHLWGVDRQTPALDAATLKFHIGVYDLRTVGLQAVPHHQQPLEGYRLQRFGKFDDLEALDRTVEQTKVEFPVADPGNHRKLFPVEAVLWHRRLTLGNPGSRQTKSLAQT